MARPAPGSARPKRTTAGRPARARYSAAGSSLGMEAAEDVDDEGGHRSDAWDDPARKIEEMGIFADVPDEDPTAECPICDKKGATARQASEYGWSEIICSNCGTYELTDRCRVATSRMDAEQKSALSCAARQASEAKHPLRIGGDNDAAKFAEPHRHTRVADNQMLLSGFTITVLTPIRAADKKELTGKIVDRQDHETHYTYLVPGYSSATTNTNVSCIGAESSVNCSGRRVRRAQIFTHNQVRSTSEARLFLFSSRMAESPW